MWNQFNFLYRTVTYSQGAALAAEFGVPFMECSSKTGENIGEAFSLLLSEVEKENPVEVVDNFSQPECIIVWYLINHSFFFKWGDFSFAYNMCPYILY